MIRQRNLVPVLFALLLAPAALPAQEGGALVFERDPRPKLFATDFTWYRPNKNERGQLNERSLACARSRPRRAFNEITATDYLSSGGYYADKYARFKRHGIDGIAYLVTDKVPDSFESENMLQVAGWAAEAGLEFFAYYDLFVTTAKQSDLILCFGPCQVPKGKKRVTDYNINTRPELYRQLRDDFANIGRHLVAPNMDPQRPGYLMLQDANGQRVLDAAGLPRPVIGLYIAREFSDRPANLAKIGELMDEVTEIFRGLGIGQPAFVLDVLYWATPRADELEDTYDTDIIDAFGEHAVAVTWYGFFDTYRGNRRGITSDGSRPPMEVWARALNHRYQEARDELAENDHALMIWPGVSTQIDTRVPEKTACRQRKVEVVYHLRSIDDWRLMLQRGLTNAWRPVGAGTPLQAVTLITNAGEWFEAGGIDYTTRDRPGGTCRLPYYPCTALLDVVTQEDRFP